VTVVNPHPHYSRRLGASNDQVQVTIGIHVTGRNLQPTLFRGNADGPRLSAGAKLKVNSIFNPFSAPPVFSDQGEVGTAIPIQIGNGATLVP